MCVRALVSVSLRRTHRDDGRRHGQEEVEGEEKLGQSGERRAGTLSGEISGF